MECITNDNNVRYVEINKWHAERRDHVIAMHFMLLCGLLFFFLRLFGYNVQHRPLRICSRHLRWLFCLHAMCSRCVNYSISIQLIATIFILNCFPFCQITLPLRNVFAENFTITKCTDWYQQNQKLHTILFFNLINDSFPIFFCVSRERMPWRSWYDLVMRHVMHCYVASVTFEM